MLVEVLKVGSSGMSRSSMDQALFSPTISTCILNPGMRIIATTMDKWYGCQRDA